MSRATSILGSISRSVRSKTILGPVDRSMRIIEIGASFNPIAPKAEGWKTSNVDHATKAELTEKYRNDPSVDVSRIEDVDFVWTAGALSDAVPRSLHGTFDALIASHCIEHAPDFVGFFLSAARLLKPSGLITLAVPDKRYCFDYFKPLTTTGEVLSAHSERRARHSRRTTFDFSAYAVFSAGSGAWGQWPIGDLRLAHSLDEAHARFLASGDESDSSYVDLHAWHFTPSSFALLILELRQLGVIDWRVDTISSAVGCEFYVQLHRGHEIMNTAVLQEQRLSLLKRTLLETKEQIDFLISGEPSLENEIESNWRATAYRWLRQLRRFLKS